MFGYKDDVVIDGALFLTLDGKTTDKTTVINAVNKALADYLLFLEPKQKVSIQNLVDAVKKVPNVIDVKMDEKDWSAKLNGVATQAVELKKGEFEIKNLEKAKLAASFLVTDSAVNASFSITELFNHD